MRADACDVPTIEQHMSTGRHMVMCYLKYSGLSDAGKLQNVADVLTDSTAS
jgi:hypothetical protein